MRCALIDAAFALSLDRSVSQVSVGMPPSAELRAMLDVQRRRSDAAADAPQARLRAIGAE